MHIFRKTLTAGWVCLAMLVFSLWVLTTPALAAGKQDVVIKVDGQAVAFDVKPYIDSQNRTIVPIRFIGERLGYGFGWDSKAKEVTVTGNGSILKIWINKKEALVNSEQVALDTVAVLDQGRAMVPLRFIVENMGANISYDQKTKVVNITKNVIELSEEPLADVSEVVKINSSVVNLRSGPGTQYDILAKAKLGDTFLVIRQQEGWNQIIIQGGKKAWVIASAVDPVPLNPFPGNQDKKDDNVVPPAEEIKGKVAIVSESVINVRSGPGTQYPALMKANFGTSFNITGQQGQWYQVALAGESGWVADWVVSLRSSGELASRTEEPGERREEPDPVPQPAQLISISEILVDTKQEDLFFSVEGNDKLNYSSFRLDNPRRIVLDFPYSTLDSSTKGIKTIAVNQGLVENIRVAQFSPEQVRLVLDLTGPAGLTLVASEGTKLTFQVGKPSLKGKTIVIDPGHAQIQSWGGSDPGATGSTGLYERDVVLDISLRAADILQAKGANVILTRKGDTNLTLAGRANVANDNNADIFVSVHCDAIKDKPTVNGTSTYYYGKVNGQEEARRKLATAIQAELLNALGRRNRGVLQENYAVLRYTAMPSALVEIAFISNPEEEQLLADPDFRTKVAEGIVRGIELYFLE